MTAQLTFDAQVRDSLEDDSVRPYALVARTSEPLILTSQEQLVQFDSVELNEYWEQSPDGAWLPPEQKTFQVQVTAEITAMDDPFDVALSMVHGHNRINLTKPIPSPGEDPLAFDFILTLKPTEPVEIWIHKKIITEGTGTGTATGTGTGTGTGTATATGTGTTDPDSSNLLPLWITLGVLAVLILGLGLGFGLRRRKRKR